jgi:hypothetical protein
LVGDKDKEIPISDIEGREIAPHSTFDVMSSGLSDSPGGTEGSYDLVDQSTGELICTVFWNCPGGDQDSSFGTRGNSTTGWLIGVGGTAPHPGAMGETFVSMSKL